jgi:hypothetical protein
MFCLFTYRSANKFLARPGRKQATATEDFDVHISYLLLQLEEYYYYLYIIIIIIIIRLASNEILSPSNKIHRKVGRATDLTAPRYEPSSNSALLLCL